MSCESLGHVMNARNDTSHMFHDVGEYCPVSDITVPLPDFRLLSMRVNVRANASIWGRVLVCEHVWVFMRHNNVLASTDYMNVRRFVGYSSAIYTFRMLFFFLFICCSLRFWITLCDLFHFYDFRLLAVDFILCQCVCSVPICMCAYSCISFAHSPLCCSVDVSAHTECILNLIVAGAIIRVIIKLVLSYTVAETEFFYFGFWVGAVAPQSEHAVECVSAYIFKTDKMRHNVWMIRVCVSY